MRRTLLALALAALAASCAPRPSTPAPGGPPGPGPMAGPMAGPMRGGGGMAGEGGMGMGRRMHQAPAVQEPTDPVLEEGKRVFDTVCAACHSLEPPYRSAPPMRMISMHLRERFGTEDEGVAHVVSWVPAPRRDRAVMPDHALERFGLMPPLALRADQLDKVARYVWSLSEGM